MTLRRKEIALIGLGFFLSGLAALVYQVAWQRILALHSGVGIYSIAVIVGAFMAGLGLGNHAGGVLSVRLGPRGSLRAFALVELAIALFALASCRLYYDVLYPRAVSLYADPWRAALGHFLALAPPTILMGASLPLLARATVRDVPGAPVRIGTLYAVNVLGAAAGAALTPWVLIRFLGIRGAVAVGAGASLLAGLIGLAIGGRERRGREADEAPESEPASAAEPDAPGGRPFALWATLYALTGFCALGLEIAWFRLINVAVKSTAFTFGTVLAIYLLGLAAGTALGVRLVGRVRRPLRAFLTCECALLAYAAAAVVVLARLPPGWPGYRRLYAYWGEYDALALGAAGGVGPLAMLYGLLSAGLCGVPTLLMGLSFAVLQKAVHADTAATGRRVGALQAANIAGGVTASLLVGLVSLGAIGTAGTLRALTACGIPFAALGARDHGARGRFAALGALLAALVVALPGEEPLWLRLHGVREPALVDEDASGVVVLRPFAPKQWWMFVGGEGISWLPFGSIHSWLGAIPAVIHPAPRSVALIGLGSGDTAWASACRAETVSVTVFEICAPQRRVLDRLAAREDPPGLRALLADPRVVVRTADGRNALGAEDRRYDLIEGDPLPPHAAHSGNLYSVEFFREGALRLARGGLLCAAMPTPRAYATFCRAFPHVLELRAGQVLVGSNEPMAVDVPAWSARLRVPAVRSYLGERIVAEVEESLRSARPAALGDRAALRPNEDLAPRDEFLSRD